MINIFGSFVHGHPIKAQHL